MSRIDCRFFLIYRIDCSLQAKHPPATLKRHAAAVYTPIQQPSWHFGSETPTRVHRASRTVQERRSIAIFNDQNQISLNM